MSEPIVDIVVTVGGKDCKNAIASIFSAGPIDDPDIITESMRRMLKKTVGLKEMVKTKKTLIIIYAAEVP